MIILFKRPALNLPSAEAFVYGPARTDRPVLCLYAASIIYFLIFFH